MPKGEEEQGSWRAAICATYSVAVAASGKRVDEDRTLQVVPIRCSINVTDTRALDSMIRCMLLTSVSKAAYRTPLKRVFKSTWDVCKLISR
jgi:hypothetical protein